MFGFHIQYSPFIINITYYIIYIIYVCLVIKRIIAYVRWKNFSSSCPCVIFAVLGSLRFWRVFSFAKLDSLAAMPSTALHISVEIIAAAFHR